jgi:hypothetical protein
MQTESPLDQVSIILWIERRSLGVLARNPSIAPRVPHRLTRSLAAIDMICSDGRASGGRGRLCCEGAQRGQKRPQSTKSSRNALTVETSSDQGFRVFAQVTARTGSGLIIRRSEVQVLPAPRLNVLLRLRFLFDS